ncbi:hypothetical protein, partial [Criblamydia sequanensis]|uniref:hypothetical protein n=1 Tax=Candidatus Criblamydia sequanensis TaxID=340071 RepID=UPI000595B60A
MQTNYVANTLVQENFRSRTNPFVCNLEIDSTGFHYNHSHSQDSCKIDKIQKCMLFNLQQIESNRYSSAVVRDLRSIYEMDKKRAESLVYLEAQQNDNLRIVSGEPSATQEASKTAILVTVVHKHFRPTKNQKPHLRYKVKKNQLVVRHFHGTGTNMGARAISELDSLMSRYSKCIEEIKEEFEKLKEQYPSLNLTETPWNSDLQMIEVVTKKRERVIEKMPKELR